MLRQRRHKIKKLSHDGIVELIHLYKERQSLWNLHSETYRDIEQKKKDLTEIAQILGSTEMQVKLKLRALRSTYLMESKKVEESKKNASTPADIYVPSLSWFEEMQFLNDCIIRRHSLPIPPGKRIRKDQSSNSETVTSTSYHRPTLASDEETPNISQLDKAIQVLMDLNNKKTDAIESFGQSVAAQLKELPPEDAYPTMAEIQNILASKKLSSLKKKGKK